MILIGYLQKIITLVHPDQNYFTEQQLKRHKKNTTMQSVKKRYEMTTNLGLKAVLALIG